LPTIDLSNATKTYYAIYACSALTDIEKLIVSENTPFNTGFLRAGNLQNVIFEGVIATTLTLSGLKLLSPVSMKSAISCLKNYSGTDKELAYTISFSDDCWVNLEADSTAPNGGTWKDYVLSLGWNA
jgi:hypothetical protein